MAYRRRQQVGNLQTYNYDASPAPADSSSSSSSASSLATKAIRASSAYRDSSLSSVYEQSVLSSPRHATAPSTQDSTIYEHMPNKDINESKQGFWGSLARKAKSIIDDDNEAQPHEVSLGAKTLTSDRAKKDQYHNSYSSSESRPKSDNPALQKGLDKIVSSFNYIGGTIGNALEEGITAVENRTADIIQETRKIQIRKKTGSSVSQNQTSNIGNLQQPPMTQVRGQPQAHTDIEMQLKASRDVAMAMAAKAKLLLRELKTVKADLAFAKERCAQLEEENRFLRESHDKGDNPEDDDLIRLQLESLLAEKARLAQENSVYARENRFLREIVEYHQLTMQDVVYLDECTEEVSEVYPMKITTGMTSLSPPPTPTIPQGAIPFPQVTENISPCSVPSLDSRDGSGSIKTVNPYVQMPEGDARRN